MNINQIIGFNALARTKNFSKAAKYVYLTQPAFSRMIASMEKELEVRLFNRSKGSPGLTVAGEKVFRETAAIQEHYEKMLKTADSEADRNRIVFCSIEIGLPDFLFSTIKDFSEKNMDYSIGFEEYTEAECYDALTEGKVDLVLQCHIPPELEDEVETLPLFSRQDCVVLSETHPLAGKKSVKYRQLDGESFVLVDPEISPLGYAKYKSILKKEKISPLKEKYTSNIISMKSHIRTGSCITMLPKDMISGKGIKSIPLDPPSEIVFKLIWLKDNKKPAVKSFVEFARLRFGQGDDFSQALL